MPDAIGGVNSHIGNIHKYAREEDCPEKTIFVITTDGMETTSHQFTYARMKQMVERQKEKYGWKFLFLDANINDIKTAGRFGISADRPANYHSSHEDTKRNYKVLSDTVSEMRCCSAPTDADLKKRIDENYKKRRKNR